MFSKLRETRIIFDMKLLKLKTSNNISKGEIF